MGSAPTGSSPSASGLVLWFMQERLSRTGQQKLEKVPVVPSTPKPPGSDTQAASRAS